MFKLAVSSDIKDCNPRPRILSLYCNDYVWQQRLHLISQRIPVLESQFGIFFPPGNAEVMRRKVV